MSHSTIRHRARARARNPAQKRPFHSTKTLALTVFHVYFHHALRSVLHVKGMENHLISNLMNLCDSTNRVTRCWTLVISVVLSACYLKLFRLLIGQLEYSYRYNDHTSHKETQIGPVKWKLLNSDPIHHFHTDHNAPYLAPLPPPQKKCIIIVLDFFWDDCNTPEKLETVSRQILG